MADAQLLANIEKIKEIDPNFVIEKSVDSKKLFLLNPEKYEFADISLKSHSICNLKNKPIMNKIIKKMKEDFDFRNFICCNLQDFLEKNRNVFTSFIDSEDILSQGELGSIYRIGLFGFINPKGKIDLDDEEKEDFFKKLTEQYLKNLRFLSASYDTEPLELDFKKYVLNPLLKLIEILGIPESHFHSNNNDYIEFNAEYEPLQYFLTGLQLHIFYEHFINLIIGESTSGEIIENPVIFTNPHYHSTKNKIEGYIEFDGFIYLAQNKIYFIECKNCYVMDFSYITQFIGKCWLIEKVYEIGIEKLFVSTGHNHPFFVGYWNYNSLQELQLFGIKDHQKDNCYLKNFFKKIRPS